MWTRWPVLSHWVCLLCWMTLIIVPSPPLPTARMITLSSTALKVRYLICFSCLLGMSDMAFDCQEIKGLYTYLLISLGDIPALAVMIHLMCSSQPCKAMIPTAVQRLECICGDHTSRPRANSVCTVSVYYRQCFVGRSVGQSTHWFAVNWHWSSAVCCSLFSLLRPAARVADVN